jgi:prepilin signal peptidase PulO-like enzyme (type II secretory pathway)
VYNSMGIMLKALVSSMIAASLLDMYALQTLKEYSPGYSSEEFMRRNLRWLRPITFFRFIIGRNALQFMQRRTLLFPAFEMAFGVCTLVALLLHGPTGEFVRSIIYCVFALPICLISWQDEDPERAVTPDSLTIPGMLIGVFTSVLLGAQHYSGIFPLSLLKSVASNPKILTATDGLLSAFGGVVVGGGLLWLIGSLYQSLRNQEGLGRGAIKAMMLVGAFAGIKGALVGLILASVAGSIVGLIGMALGRISYRETAIPFSSFIAVGGLVPVIAGPAIVNWYIKLYK